jgi:hypothetical protein
MTPIELWESAGRPGRAVVTFAQPVEIYTGRSVTKADRVEAYLGAVGGRLAYRFRQNARKGYIVPDCVASIIPVEKQKKDWFTYRLDHAVDFILSGQRNDRQLDDAFENYDGDQMATAIVRRARQNPHLDKIIREEYSWPQCDWYQLAALRDGLSNDELKLEAERTRAVHSALGWILHYAFYGLPALKDGVAKFYPDKLHLVENWGKEPR